MGEVEHPNGGELSERRRQRALQPVVIEVELMQVRGPIRVDLAESVRQLAAQLVVAHVEHLDVHNPAKLGGHRAVDVVDGEIDPREIVKLAHQRPVRDRPRDVVVAQR